MAHIHSLSGGEYDIIDPENRLRDVSCAEDATECGEDYDLHILAEVNNEWAVWGDEPGNTEDRPWLRIAEQGGTRNGLQDINNSEIEWPNRDSLFLSFDELLEGMRDLTPCDSEQRPCVNG